MSRRRADISSDCDGMGIVIDIPASRIAQRQVRRSIEQDVRLPPHPRAREYPDDPRWLTAATWALCLAMLLFATWCLYQISPPAPPQEVLPHGHQRGGAGGEVQP